MRYSAHRRARAARPLHLERLESRQPLATLVDGFTVRFQEPDGDTVLVSLSRPLLTAANAGAAFRFDSGGVDGGDGRQRLQDIRLTEFGAAASGVNVFARVSPTGAAGDGAVAIGQISAEGVDLGSVRIDGSLGRVRSGDANLLTPGLASLSFYTLGVGNLYADGPAGADHRSRVQGRINTVRGIDLRGSLEVRGGAAGQIGSIELVGGMIGDDLFESGSVSATGAIGTVAVAFVQGGRGDGSGTLRAARFQDIRVRDPARGVLGGDGTNSGSIFATGSIGTLTINGDLRGGTRGFSGSVRAGSINRFSARAITGGSGPNSGLVDARGTIGSLAADVVGGAAVNSGCVFAARLDSMVRGDVVGGDAFFSGTVYVSGTLGAATFGRIEGGRGDSSGMVKVGGVRGAVIAASIKGGAGGSSGSIEAAGRLPAVRVSGDIEGGAGADSGRVGSLHSVGSVSCRNLIGRGGSRSGTIYSLSGARPLTVPGTIDSVRVARSVYGGDGESSGSIVADHTVKNVVIGTIINPAAGSLRGGAGVDSGTIRFGPPVYTEATVGYGAIWPRVQLIDVVGGAGLRSGGIRGGLLKVRVSLVIGGSGEESGSIAANHLWMNAERHQREGLGIAAGGLADIEGGSGAWSGSVRAKSATVVIRDLRGGEGPNSGSLVFTHQSQVRARTIEGGGGTRSGRVQGHVLRVIAEGIRGGVRPGTVEAGAIVARNLDVELRSGRGTRGELVAGAGGEAGLVTRNGAIIAKQLTATLGGIVGSATNPALVAALDLITRLQVNGSVDRGLIVAGHAFDAAEIVPPGAAATAGILWPLAMNADARIDLVDIRGDLRRSSIAAGVRPVDSAYGNLDDAKLVGGRPLIDSPTVASRIELVLIRGAVVGTPDVTGDTFGIVAQQLGRVRVGYGPTIDPRNFWRETFPARSGPTWRLLYTGDDPTRRDVWLRSLGGT
jgi:hypothetical protein